jgi:AraC family transcriptional regulator
MLHGTIVAESRSGDIRITETRYSGGAMLARHQHADPYISILVEGDYTEVRADIPQRCDRGTVIVHHPDEEHADYFPNAGRCLNIEILDRSHAAYAALHDGAHDGGLHTTIQQFARAYASTTRCDDAAIAGLRTQLASGDKKPVANRPGWLHRALDEFCWTDTAPLEHIARGVGVHQVHFSRTFREHMGMTPAQYRRRTRIRVASQLLLDSQADLAEVAQATGFHDQSHFTHAFVIVAGLPPARYRTIFQR